MASLWMLSAAIAAAAPGAGVAAAAAQPAPVVSLPLDVDLAHPRTRFEGFGTALAWFAEVTGGWPDPERTRLADLFYGADGLGWTIARFNIGGGDDPDAPRTLRTGAAVPGYWRRPAGATGRDWWRPDDPAAWDWAADPNQRWWLDAVKARVPESLRLFEAFSNSPPWFMTVSGRVSGAARGEDGNLRPGQEGAFATYLARTTAELERRHGIRFRTLSPVNEPDTDYWYTANTQEGAHWSPAAQDRIIRATAAALRAERLDTVIAAPDETNAQLFVLDWLGWGPAARAAVGQLNLHSYGTENQSAVRDIAAVSGKRLWMSENDTPAPQAPEDFDDMRSPLALAGHIVQDLRTLRPAAWVFWQAVETLSARDGKKGSNWGLVKADLTAPAAGPHPLHVTAKYHAMQQFSRLIRPGYRLVDTDDPDTVAALSPDGATLVLVHVNGGPSPRRLTLRTGATPRTRWAVETIVTDATHRFAALGTAPATAAPRLEAPPLSIASFRLTRAR